MKTIPLIQGKVAIVDDEDFERVLAAGKWYATSTKGIWYALRHICLPNGKRTTQSMHRFIMGVGYGNPLEVDHKDRVNTLDNRRKNLRVTLDQNLQNRGLFKNNTSGFKGITWIEARGKWRAEIQANGKRQTLGHFLTPELAAAAYDAAALELHGEFACTNQMLAAAA